MDKMYVLCVVLIKQ